MNSEKQSHDKQFPGQHDGEVVEVVFRQHPLVMRKALIVGLLMITAGVLPLDFPQVYASDRLASIFTNIAFLVPVLVLVAWIYRWIGWYYTVYIVTNKRILEIHQKGLFDRRVDEWQLDVISNVNYHIGGFQAVLFGYGTITARSYIGDLVMPTIHKPAEIHAQIVDAVRRAGGGSTPTLN